MSRLTVCSLLLLCAATLTTRGQSFSTFTGRNHPELSWRVAVTEHFKIAHPARLDRIAAEAAPIAETTFDSLSAALDVTFDERIRIYLSDQDAIVNGFAVPFGNGYTDIWVHVNDAAVAFTGRAKWLRRVLSHELVHIFHYQATQSSLGVWANVLGASRPRFWMEGLAQYESEWWSAQRGERWLRAAVLGDDLSYNDGQSLWNGRLLYASGHSQVRYFVQQHGDSTLTDLLHHRKDVLFGLAEVHDFGAAFKKEVGLSYERFYEQWRRDVNVYYNTLAGQLETLDSLRTDTLSVPGRYVDDVAYSPDTSHVAALTQLSPARPVHRLHVIDRSSGKVTIAAEGPIEPPVAWGPDGARLAFSRQTRGPHGAVVDDLFIVDADGDEERRLTYGRRTSAPTFAPDGERLAFVATRDGTANVHLLNLATGKTTSVTEYDGDVQITGLQWHPTRDTLALARMGPDGGRELVLLDLGTSASTALTDPATDDRRPEWSPDGAHLAYTSLRDGVPNAFVYDVASDTHRRVTHLVRGATVHDWIPADSTFGAGSSTGRGEGALVVSTALSKQKEEAFRIPADRSARSVDPSVPAPYAAWTTTRPPHPIPRALPPDPSLIQKRKKYEPLDNITHRASLVLPYVTAAGDVGISGVTSWTEPLGKHNFNAIGSLSVTDPGDNSEVVASYFTRQWSPTLGLSLFSASSSARIYGNDLLVEKRIGGEFWMQWPIDWRVRPYVSTTFAARLRYADLTPLNRDAFTPALGALRPPQSGQQASLQLRLTRRKRPPYRHTLVHPLAGWGVRMQAMGAASILGGDSSFLRVDLAGYKILPSVGKHRIFLYGRLQAQTGSSFPQDYIGFSRYDAIEIPLPGTAPITLGNAERVRGYRSYALGSRVAFGTVEYRMPVAASLQTELFGAIEFGRTTMSAFVDGGLVWSGNEIREGVQRAGAGLELKNALHIGGLRIGHALGLAQPISQIGGDDVHLYYRVQTALPF